jgi:phage shock protein PspC (stress-responsive transcriptional regulator)
MNCNEAVEALIATIESGGVMTDEQREHLRTCARCRELLDAAKHFQSILGEEPSREPRVDSAAVESVVRAQHQKSVAAKIVTGVIAVAAFGLLLAWSLAALDLPIAVVELMAIATIVLVFAIGPLVILYLVARALARRQGKQLYRRLHPERWWLGVCVGLADATRIDKGWFRLGFVMLTIFGNGAGLLFYVVMALAMPVHPADREYLWRFQARRMLARIRSR